MTAPTPADFPAETVTEREIRKFEATLERLRHPTRPETPNDMLFRQLEIEAVESQLASLRAER